MTESAATRLDQSFELYGVLKNGMKDETGVTSTVLIGMELLGQGRAWAPATKALLQLFDIVISLYWDGKETYKWMGWLARG